MHNEQVIKDTKKKYMSVGEIKDATYDLVKVTLGQFGELMKVATNNEERKKLLNLPIEDIELSDQRRPENITIKFNQVLIDYINKNGGLSKEGSPLLRFYRILT